jgi:hypothetical protein
VRSKHAQRRPSRRRFEHRSRAAVREQAPTEQAVTRMAGGPGMGAGQEVVC